jgi:predicted phosphodiesterase
VAYNLNVLLRYLILSDVHSNLEALEECLAAAHGKFDEVLCLGDLVGYGPEPNPVVERVRGISRVIVRGNHDKACSGVTGTEDFNPLARIATEWTRERLSTEHLSFLRALPAGPIEVDGLELVHGSPRDEDEYVVDSYDALPILEGLAFPLVFFGHTHIQGGFAIDAQGRFTAIGCQSPSASAPFTLQIAEGARYLINPGSVGQPRDGDWRAAFAIFDADQRVVAYYRVPYDVATTQKKMRLERLPDPLIQRLQWGR